MSVDNSVELIVGATYRQPVDSQQGYEDWEYLGETIDTPQGTLYAFKQDRGVQWFDKRDIKMFTRIE